MDIRIQALIRHISKDKLYILPKVYKYIVPTSEEASQHGFNHHQGIAMTGGGFDYTVTILAKGDHHIVFEWDSVEEELYVYSFDFSMDFYNHSLEALHKYSMDYGLRGSSLDITWYAFSLFQYFYDTSSISNLSLN